MGQKNKALEKFRQNPKNVRFDEIDHLLITLGFQKRHKGSHATYVLKTYRITIPFRKPYVLPIYVKNLLVLLDDLEASLEQ